MLKREVYDLIRARGEKEWGKDEGKSIGGFTLGFDIYEFADIVWEISTVTKRYAEEEREVGDIIDLEKECVIDSWETWYLINKVTKEVELFCEMGEPISYFEKRVAENPNLELYAYWAGDGIITRLW